MQFDRQIKGLDKSKWPDGPWQSEPDLAEWRDPDTGIPCLALRHPRYGHWCGYVAIPADHPWVDQDIYRLSSDGTELDVDVDWDDPRRVNGHKEITFGPARCQQPREDGEGEIEGQRDPHPWHRVCHAPRPGESQDVRWIGFDCGHQGYHDPDYEPGSDFNDEGATYRDLPYVVEVCSKMAKQADQAMKAVA